MNISPMHLVRQIEHIETRTLPSADQARVKLQNLSLSYGSTNALTDVNLAVFTNKITALIGPSGCGKSSLLHSITRLTDLEPSVKIEGDIIFENQSVLQMQQELLELRRKIGMIHQQPAPFPFSIRKNFEIPLKEHGVKNKDELNSRMQDSLVQVGLWNDVKNRLNQSAVSLSGGQQQRLCIARSLALQPSVLLLDEPCSALDPYSTQLIEDLLTQLKSRCTILIVTHNLAQARRIADFTGVFWHDRDCGRLIEFGYTQDIFNQPRHHFTAAYIKGYSG
jgi:phosphate transport system ATP-binding protein